MAKSLSGLWLRSMRSLGKTQRAQTRLLKSLLPKPARSPAVRRTKVKSPVRRVQAIGALAKVVKPVRKPAAKTSAQTVARAAPLPGTWKLSYFSATSPALAASGKRMAYWLYLPSGASTNTAAPLPLVVMLHGCQQTAPDFATATRMNQLAERKGFAVLYPQQSAASDAHRCWHWYQRAIQKGQGEVQTIASLITQVQQERGLDASRTYAAGLSAGAALATILALRHPELIAALGLHSAPVFGTADSAMSAYRVMQRGAGSVFGEVAGEAARSIAAKLPPLGGMPAIVIHGDRDAVVRRINARQLGQQLQIVNAATITRSEGARQTFPARTGGRSPRHAYSTTTHYAGRKPQLVQCDITSLGHAWSGGDDSVSFSTRAGPNATLMMWAFFARHRLKG
jgi:poly(hydroxyalkanoate) depolymerase family esterase